MTAPTNLYPFATQDGKAIPLDIIRPSALLSLAVNTTAAGPVDITNAYSVGVFFSAVECLVGFGASVGYPLTTGVLHTNTLLLPANTILVSSLPSNIIYVSAEKAGILYLQLIEKWAGLGLEKQYIRK